eukprot:7629974-Pyramimonas_sp.AAC.1
MSNSFKSPHHRREDAVIVVGVISIGAVTGRAAVIAVIVTNISINITASNVADVAMILCPPKSPTRIQVPAGKCPAVNSNRVGTFL